jgi:integrase/recombinase XerD
MPLQACFKQILEAFIADNPTAKSIQVLPGITVQPLAMADEKNSNDDLIIRFPEEQIGQITTLYKDAEGNLSAFYKEHRFPLEFFSLSEDASIFHPCIVADDNENHIFDDSGSDSYFPIDLYEIVHYSVTSISNSSTKKSRIIPEELIGDFFELLIDDKAKRLIYAIAYFTGSRIGEVLKLEVGDISPTTIRFREENAKTKVSREMEMCDDLKFYLEGYKKPVKGFLFPSIRGATNQKYVGIGKHLKKIGAIDKRFAGLSTNSFLRSAASRMHDDGFSDREIAAFVGLKSTRSKSVRALYED